MTSNPDPEHLETEPDVRALRPQNGDAERARLGRQISLGVELRRTFESVSADETPEKLRRLAQELDARLGAVAAPTTD